MIYAYDYPANRIKVEVTIPDRVPTDRADIVIFSDDDCKKPYAVIERKKDGVTDAEFLQLIAVRDSLCLTMKIRLSHFVKMSIPHLPSMIYPISFQCGEDPAAENMLLFLYEQQKLGLPYRNELMESAAASLITYILQRYMDTMQPLYSIALTDQRLLDMVNYMYNHYRTITLHDLAAEFHYNESYLSRMFQEQAGRSFSETVKDFKLQKAAELLKTKAWKLDHICEEIGYHDTRQFIRSFKQMFGVTPDRFRKLEQQTVHQKQTS